MGHGRWKRVALAVAWVALGGCLGDAPAEEPSGVSSSDGLGVSDEADDDVVPCEPATCAQLGVECGEVEDGCAGVLTCGGCLAGWICGSDGSPNTCVAVGPPTVAILGGPAPLWASSDASVAFACEPIGCTAECSLDLGPFEGCLSPLVILGLADGGHILTVRPRLNGWLGEPVVWSWETDTVAPVTTLTAGPGPLEASAVAEVDFACDDATCAFTCSLDDAPFATCAPPLELAGLADGPHTLAVRANDPAGNVGEPASLAWVVDTTAPITSYEEIPSGAVPSGDALVAFTCDEAACTFLCSLDGAEFATCESPVPLSDLAEGLHTLMVRATDPLGHEGPAAVASWTVDLTPPELVLTSAPGHGQVPSDATFTFECSGEPCTLSCSAQGGPYLACESPHVVTGLGYGQHTVSIRGSDAAGNSTTVEHTWHIVWLAELSAGHAHACGVGQNGSLWCWGWNLEGQLGLGDHEPRPGPALVGATGWGSVSAGAGHTCGVRSDGTLWCWGANSGGQLGLGDLAARTEPVQVGTDTTWARVSAGGSSTCAAKQDGTLWCWGWNGEGQLGVGDTLKRAIPTAVASQSAWVFISVGVNHSCAVQQDSSLWCWGSGLAGRLGVGDSLSRTVPTRVGELTGWTSVSAGQAHTCGLRGGALFCWGSGIGFRLGIGMDVTGSNVPVAVEPETLWETVDAGGTHSCGTRGDGALLCWGSSTNGQVGLGLTSPQPTPWVVDEAAAWTLVVAGGDFTCGLRSGRLLCWGNNMVGQAGLGVLGDKREPVPVASPDAVEIVAGGSHACTIGAGGEARCWGGNANGQLGVGDHVVRKAPTLLPDPGPWIHLAAGHSMTCGVKTEGSLWCWGFGYLGPALKTTNLPVQIGTDVDWATVDVGFWNMCATRKDGTLWCWGENDHGELGSGDTAPRKVPTQVGTATTWSWVSCGDAHTCAGQADGTIWCWGSSSDGQLGVGVKDYTLLEPKEVTALDQAVSGHSGGHHACVLTEADELWCWGRNSTGALGIGSTELKATPTQVGEDAEWELLGLGYWHTCGVRLEGSLWCWGANAAGQLGTGWLASETSPARVGDASDWVAVSAGGDFTCGLRSGDPQVSCWGSNAECQLGDGTCFIEVPTEVVFP